MKNIKIKNYTHKNLLDKFIRAKKDLDNILNKTPLIYSDYLSKDLGAKIYLKPENLQKTGSFKIRGAYNKINSLSDKEKKNGIIASSAGNHAAGVSFSAKKKKIKATIVMPKITPLLKVKNTESLGAKVILHGDTYDDAYKKALEISKKKKLTFIHPFDDIDVVIGQGTIGMEILNELPNVTEVFVQIGGGGLISGIALLIKLLNPKVKVIGVLARHANSMQLSIKNNKVTTLDEVKTVAEGVAVKTIGSLNFEIAKKCVDEFIVVEEKEIMEAVLEVMETHKLVVEAAGVLSLAGAKKYYKKHTKRASKEKNGVVILSGGNIDCVTIANVINRGMIERGRIMSFSVELPDRPGKLLEISRILAELNANVIELEHNQFKAFDRYSNKVVLEVTVETNGKEHIERIINKLEKNGFSLKRIY